MNECREMFGAVLAISVHPYASTRQPRWTSSESYVGMYNTDRLGNAASQGWILIWQSKSPHASVLPDNTTSFVGTGWHKWLCECLLKPQFTKFTPWNDSLLSQYK